MPPNRITIGGYLSQGEDSMETLLFSWDEDSMCWECTLSDEKIYMSKCQPSHTLMYTQRNNDTHATYGIFDSSHEAQKYLYVKYNKEVRYRDPNEVKYAGKYTNND